MEVGKLSSFPQGSLRPGALESIRDAPGVLWMLSSKFRTLFLIVSPVPSPCPSEVGKSLPKWPEGLQEPAMAPSSPAVSDPPGFSAESILWSIFSCGANSWGGALNALIQLLMINAAPRNREQRRGGLERSETQPLTWGENPVTRKGKCVLPN